MDREQSRYFVMMEEIRLRIINLRHEIEGRDIRPGRNSNSIKLLMVAELTMGDAKDAMSQPPADGQGG